MTPHEHGQVGLIHVQVLVHSGKLAGWGSDFATGGEADLEQAEVRLVGVAIAVDVILNVTDKPPGNRAVRYLLTRAHSLRDHPSPTQPPVVVKPAQSLQPNIPSYNLASPLAESYKQRVAGVYQKEAAVLTKWRQIKGRIGRWTRAEEGVAASEYAILLALIVLGSMGIIGTVGSRIAGLYSIIRDAMPAGLI